MKQEKVDVFKEDRDEEDKIVQELNEITKPQSKNSNSKQDSSNSNNVHIQSNYNTNTTTNINGLSSNTTNINTQITNTLNNLEKEGQNSTINDSKVKGIVNKKPINIIPINKTDIKSAKSNSPVSKQQNIKEISVNTYQNVIGIKNSLSPQANNSNVNKFSSKVSPQNNNVYQVKQNNVVNKK